MFKSITENEYVFSVITKISGVFLGLIYSILFSRYFRSELRGMSTVIYTYSEFIMLILCLGIYQAYPYYKKKGKKNVFEEYVNIVSGLFLVYVLIGVIMMVLFRPRVEICTMIMLIPFSYATKELNYVVMIEKPIVMNRAAIFLNFFENILIVLFAIFFQGTLKACVAFMLIREFVYFLVAVNRLQIKITSIKPSLKGICPYIKFGFIPMLTVVMMELNYKADVAMLDFFHVNKSDIGIYGLGVSLASKVWLIPDAFKDILTSKLAKGKKEDEVCKVLRVSLLIILLFVAALIIIGKPFINLLYGKEYREAYKIVVLMLTGVIGMVFYKIIYSYHVINGYQMTNLLILTGAGLLNIFLNFILIPQSGHMGAAVASSISYLFCGLFYLVAFSKRTGISYKEMMIIKKDDMIGMQRMMRSKKD